MKPHLRPTLAIAALALAVLPFQNCSGVTYGTKTAEKPQNSGNGDGYTGKLYVEFGTCGADTQAVKAKIWAVPELDQYTLLRENCDDLVNSLKIDPTFIKKLADLTKLKYKERVFVIYAAAPRIDAAGPFGPLGMSVALTGENLCGPGGVSVEEPAAANPLFGISNVNCMDGGKLLTFNPPTNFYSRTEPVVNLRLINLALPANLNWAAFPLKPGEMLTPKVTSFNDVPSLLNGREVEIIGQFFGNCPNVSVQIFAPAGNIAVPVTIVQCSDTKLNIMPANNLAALIPGTFVRVSNGARFTDYPLP